MTKQETKAEETRRMWASASFVGVLIVIGLPLWWKTTEVYRVALPYDQINSFLPRSHCVTAELTVLADDEPTATQIIDLVTNTFEHSDVLKLKVQKLIIKDDLLRILNSVADEQEAVEEVGKVLDLTRTNSFYVVQRKPLFKDVWLGGERVMFFRDNKAAPTLVKALEQWVYQPSVLEGAISEVPDSARQTRFPPGSEYHVVLSVVNPAPDKLNVEFNAGEVIEDYVGSFADELSSLHNLTLRSQWLYLLDFDFQPTKINDDSEWGRHFGVRQDRLPLLLTRLEERAATHVSDKPVINLALYAVPCQRAPLVIYDNNDEKVSSPVQAFMSPRWGGVLLGSPTASDCAVEGGAATWRPDPRVVMGTFVSQLRKLLGITDKDSIPGAYLEPLRSVTPRRWEVDSLMRIRALEQISDAQRTLQSLAQLLGKISNIVINDEVGASINSAAQSSERAGRLLREGDVGPAGKAARDAHTAAEAAFLDPSLLALLYFPDDQKYAIYIPLFLPIMFPVVLSLRSLALWCRGTDKQKTE